MGKACCAACEKSSMGDAQLGQQDMAKYLRVEINRFCGPSVPKDRRISDTPWPYTGPLDFATALAASSIYMNRWNEAAKSDPSLMDGQRVRNLMSAADPIGFVTQNFNEVHSTIQGFADSLGLKYPAKSPPPMRPNGEGADAKKYLLIGAAILGLWFLYKR